MGVFNFNERSFIGSWKRSTQLSSDGYPKAKPGGAEFKWDTLNHGGTNGGLLKDTYLEDQLDVNRDPQGAEASGPFTSADGTLLNAVDFDDSKPASDEFPIKAGMKVLRYGTPIMEDTDGKFILATGALTVANAGKVFLVNETVVYDPTKSATEQLDPKSLYPIAIDGGRVFEARILASDQNVIGVDVDGADVTIAGLPTLAQLKAALPGIFYAR